MYESSFTTITIYLFIVFQFEDFQIASIELSWIIMFISLFLFMISVKN